jgi:hypothetical protein
MIGGPDLVSAGSRSWPALSPHPSQAAYERDHRVPFRLIVSSQPSPQDVRKQSP